MTSRVGDIQSGVFATGEGSSEASPGIPGWPRRSSSSAEIRELMTQEVGESRPVGFRPETVRRPRYAGTPMAWDPGQYLKFADHRLRPAIDLLNRIDAAEPAEVVDLGAGAGNVTRLLKLRWPGARITGVDASKEMLEKAAAAAPEIGRASRRERV